MSTITSTPAASSAPCVAFIGGGNMASAVIGGLLQAGHPTSAILVVEPHAPQAEHLQRHFGLRVLPAASAALELASLVVWAVKPQLFQTAAAPCKAYLQGALHLSVMAGIRCADLARATGTSRIVRSMPNTPALVGQGMTGLFAMPQVTLDERMRVEQLLTPTGSLLWVEREEQLDAVTALSGSGPAYMFFVLEAMIQAGTELGLSAAQARQLAQQTMTGSAALATQSTETPDVLRQRVTSKGGTTYAALTSMEDHGVKPALIRAMHAAARRAHELGDEFGQG